MARRTAAARVAGRPGPGAGPGRGELVAGIDVGARTSKAVLMDRRERAVGRAEVRSGAFIARAAEEALQLALSRAGAGRRELAYIAATGWGRYQVPFRHIQITDVTCHAMGAVLLCPGTRTVLDVGAQNSRAIRVEPSGRVEAFRFNNRCAAGAGQFLEKVSQALELELEELGNLSLRAREAQPISSICAVLAESEVINLVSQEVSLEEIVLAVHRSLTERIASLVRQIGVEPQVTLTGSVGLNPGMVRALEERLEVSLNVPPEGALAGALGAARLGLRRLRQLEAQAA